MITINEISLSIIIQVIILLIFSSFILYFLWRNSQKKLKACLATTKNKNEQSPSASVEHYLAAEIKLNDGRFELLYEDKDHDDIEIVEPDWLMKMPKRKLRSYGRSWKHSKENWRICCLV